MKPREKWTLAFPEVCHRLAQCSTVFAVAAVAIACGGVASTGDAGRSIGGTGGAGGLVHPGSGGNGAGGGTVVRVPATHRPVAEACSPSGIPAPGNPSVTQCSSDSDCTSGANGRCAANRVGSFCVYDECFSDADCSATGPTSVCQCGDSGSYYGNNVCSREGNCETDADCAGNYCSPTLGTCGHYTAPVGYYCHTKNDTCVDDADCPMGYCAFSPIDGRWSCSTAECVG